MSFPVYRELMKMFFGDFGGLVEAIKYYITPDLWSALKGRFYEDIWAEFKLGIFFLVCVLWAAAVYQGFVHVFYPAI